MDQVDTTKGSVPEIRSCHESKEHFYEYLQLFTTKVWVIQRKICVVLTFPRIQNPHQKMLPF